ncbi:MAG: ATP-binding protein [Bacteroidales bacterium]
MKKLSVFISSVQKEFAVERQQVYEHLQKDPFISQYFIPVMFEELPAASKSADKVFLEGIKNTDVYIVLIGKEYGNKLKTGLSSTETEFDMAMETHKTSFAFIREDALENQESQEKRFLQKVQKKLTYKRYNEPYDLLQEINRAFVSLLQEKGYLHSMSFDATLHPAAGIEIVDKSRINEFVEIANEQRGFPLKIGSSVKKVLTHLDLISDTEKLYNSVLLAFTEHPQKYFPSAIVKCAHFHGTRVEKPIPAQIVIKGDIFTQIDETVDFILSKIPVSVGTRKESNQAPFKYEIPREVISEAVVNAVAHRDYNSKGSVEVRLFKDRLEIKNPGRLPKELSIQKLEEDHGSYPFNPRLAEILYQTAYIERFGTGTSDIFNKVKEAGLKKPDFDLSEGIKITIWRSFNPTDQETDQDADYDTDQDADYDKILVNRLLVVLEGEMSRKEIMDLLDLRHTPHFRENYLNPAEENNLIEMTKPESPTSKHQKYRLTKKGKAIKINLM